MPNEAYGQREATRMQKSIADDPLDRDWPTHVKRVAQDTALKAVRRSAGPDRSGSVRVLIDKVGGNR
jgi:hypothetical protein